MPNKDEYWNKKRVKFQREVESETWRRANPTSEARIERVAIIYRRYSEWVHMTRSGTFTRAMLRAFRSRQKNDLKLWPVAKIERRWRVVWHEGHTIDAREEHCVEWTHIEMAQGLRDGINFLYARRLMAQGTKAALEVL